MAYSDATLATFMSVELGAAGTALSLTAGSDQIVEAVAEVAAILGGTIAEQTDDLKTRTIARWQAWRTAKGAAASQYDLSSDGSSLKRSQFFDHINLMLADAEAAAMGYSEVQAVLAGSGGVAVVTSVYDSSSPYAWPTSEWS